MSNRVVWMSPILAVAMLWGACFGGSPKIEQWGRFEAAVANPKVYANPYEDVSLEVAYTRPDGQVVKFWGFYDGDGVWRMRFMPDQVGTWRYFASFSDGTPGMEGTFECVPSEIPGMISAYQDNPVWFGFKGGGAVVVRSLHVGDRFFADRDNSVTGEPWSGSRRKAFLDWVQGQGYNMLSIASHYLNRDSGGRGKGWNTPDLWDAQKQQPNPAEYRRMERILDDLASRGIMVYPFAGFFGRGSDFPRDQSKQDLYIRYTLARLGSYWNVLLLVGGPEPRLKGNPYLSEDEINRLGRRIRELDVFGHLLSVHNPTGDDQFKNADWPSFGVLQGPKTLDRRRLSQGLLRNHHDARPLYAQETLWAGNKYHPQYSLDDLRKNAYVLTMSAAAINFGDMDGDSSSGFSGTLDLDRKVQQRHDILKRVWDFFETVPFYRMKPRQDLVDNGYCLAEPDYRYMVYLENPGSVSVRVGGGTWQVKWINARNTSDIRDGGTTTTGQSLASPQSGDWLLYLTRTHEAQSPAMPAIVAEGSFPDIVVDRQGNVHLVYARGKRVYYRLYSGGQWFPEQFTDIGDVPWMARAEPDIVVDDLDHKHIFAGSEYVCLFADTLTRMSLPGNMRDTELAIDKKRNVYLVHRGGNNGGFVGLRKLVPGAKEWVALTDPDKPLLGSNDHVYPDLAISPVDDSLHVVYRHGNPKKTAYRQSRDGGRTWPTREGITDNEPEAAHIAVDPSGNVYVTDGGGNFFWRTDAGWQSEGRVVEAPKRGQPELACDRQGTVYCTCWGGRYNVRANGKWIGSRKLPFVTGKPQIGFVEPAGADGFAYLAWEEGDKGDPDTGMESGSVVVVGRLLPDGTVAGF